MKRRTFIKSLSAAVAGLCLGAGISSARPRPKSFRLVGRADMRTTQIYDTDYGVIEVRNAAAGSYQRRLSDAMKEINNMINRRVFEGKHPASYYEDPDLRDRIRKVAGL